MNRDNLGVDNRYTYEATFVAGSIGINLQPTRSGLGAYVDSFRRASDESLLPAELSGFVKLGDVMMEVNKEDVSHLPLSDIPRVLAASKRPMCIKFERVAVNFSFSDVARDSRKLPWLMQYLVDCYGVEAAITDQAKVMCWLECDQYVNNYKILSERDEFSHAMQIIKKFFTEGSTFSLLSHCSEKIKKKLDSLNSSPGISLESGAPISLREMLGDSNERFLRLFRDCQSWIALDMNSNSFKKFSGSTSASRLSGYLIYSPQFVKMSLFDILRCDRRMMYMLAFLCQIKRHTSLFCYNMLCDDVSLDCSVEGATREDLRALFEKGFVCAHILKIDEFPAGPEDLPMIERLKHYIGVCDADSIFKGVPAYRDAINSRKVISPLSFDRAMDLECTVPCSAQASDDFSSTTDVLPLLSSSKECIAEIRNCLLALRNSMLRELVQDLAPKFFGSKEFELLLWEINACKDSSPAVNPVEINLAKPKFENRRNSYDFDDDLDSVGSSAAGSDLKSGSESGAAVPNGAVQRLLRKIIMPASMTMHRAPLSMLEQLRVTKETDIGSSTDPLGWVATFDTDFSKILPENAIDSLLLNKFKDPILSMSAPIAIYDDLNGADLSGSKMSSEINLPHSIEEFFVPSGKIVWEEGSRDPVFSCQLQSRSFPLPKLFNFVVSGGGDIGLLYVAALVMHRPLNSTELEKWDGFVRSVDHAQEKISASPNGNTMTPSISPVADQTLTPFSGRLPPKSNGSTSAFKNNVDGVSNDTEALTPKDMGSTSSAIRNNWIGKVEKITSSPFFDKIKGITPPNLFRTQTSLETQTVLANVEKKSNFPSVRDHSVPTASEASPSNRDDDDPGQVDSRQKKTNGDPADCNSPLLSIKVEPVSLQQHYEGIESDFNGDYPKKEAEIFSPPSSTSNSNTITADNVEQFCEEPLASVFIPSLSDTVQKNAAGPLTSPSGSVWAQPSLERRAVYGCCLVSKYPNVDASRCLLHSFESSLKGKNKSLSVQALEPKAVIMHAHEKNVVSILRQRCHRNNENELASNLSERLDFDPNPLIRNINTKNLVALYFALMLEQKIAVISSKLTALTCLGEFLREALLPFRWNHVYVPVLPKKMSNQILECPTPFFVGIQRDFFDAKSVPADVCVLDIDHDACRMSPELTKALKSGRRLIRGLDLILRPSYVCCDEPLSTTFASSENMALNIAHTVMNLFKTFSWEVVLGIHECGISSIDHDEVVVLFDEAMFMAFKRRRAAFSLLPAEDSFLKLLVRTQAFSVAATNGAIKRLTSNSRPSSRGGSPFISARSRTPSIGTPASLS